MNVWLATVLKVGVLTGTALMLYSKISTGTLTYYINQRFVWLPFVALIIVVMLALATTYRLFMQPKSASTHSHDHEDEAGHEHVHNTSWLTLGALLVPVVFGLLAPTKPLGASALGTRGISQEAPVREAGTIKLSTPSKTDKNILDWLRDFSRTKDLNTFNGQTADVIGFVYNDPKAGAGRFWVARFTVSCCVADANAIGMLVQTHTSPNDLQTDQWVRVVGKIAIVEFDGEQMPIIVASKIEPTVMPENPYLQP